MSYRNLNQFELKPSYRDLFRNLIMKHTGLKFDGIDAYTCYLGSKTVSISYVHVLPASLGYWRIACDDWIVTLSSTEPNGFGNEKKLDEDALILKMMVS